VTLSGRDFCLGRYGTVESRSEYDRLVAEWLAAGRQIKGTAGAMAHAELTVNELILGYVRHVDSYYQKDGQPTSEPRNIKLALRPLRHLYGHTSARTFGPLALKVVRQAMVDSGLCRTEVNKRVRRIVRAFRWAAENEL